MILRFTIPGEPVTKGSRITGLRKDGTAYSRDANPKTKGWTVEASKVIWSAAKGLSFASRPVLVRATFYCRQPKKPTHPHPSRGDVDKMARALLDAITASGVLSDDRHVVQLDVGKCYGEPRVVGEIISLDVPCRLAA